MTIGDVFSIVASIFGIFLTSWCTVVVVALLFPTATERARRTTDQPVRIVLQGFGILFTVGLVGAILLANPLPPLKLVGWLVVLSLLVISSVGTSGIARECGRRIEAMDPSMAPYPAFARGAAFVVGATILPVLGWFALLPLLLAASVGAGWKAVVSSPRRSSAVEV